MRALLAILAAAVAVVLLPASASAELVPSRSAAGFRDSFGVGTHIVYFDTAYGDWTRIVDKLDELGVDHVRDGVYGNPDWRDWNERYYQAVEMAVAHGHHFDFLMGEPGFRAGTLDQLIDVVRGRLKGAADALESPNEYDLFHGSPTWPSELRSYVQQLYAKAKADPYLRNLPVVGPSLVYGDSRDKLGSLVSSLDLGNLHPYTGGEAPSPAHLSSEATLAAKVSGNKPLYATEVGFHNAMSATQGQPPVPEDVAADYLLRTFLEHFRAGIQRTYAYELIDEKPEPSLTDPEEHFGLLRNDYSEKPAFVALKNMITAIGRPSPVAAHPLDLGIAGNTDGVQKLLLQRSATRYTLVLWQSASEWDTNARRKLAVTDHGITVDLPADATASVVRPTRGADGVALGTTRHLALQVPADPILVDLDFGATAPGTFPPSPPATSQHPPAATCPTAPPSGGTVVRHGGTLAAVSLVRSRAWPIHVVFCSPTVGRARLEVRRIGPQRRGVRRVLALRRLPIRGGHVIATGLHLKASGTAHIAGVRKWLVEIRFLPRGARTPVFLRVVVPIGAGGDAQRRVTARKFGPPAALQW